MYIRYEYVIFQKEAYLTGLKNKQLYKLNILNTQNTETNTNAFQVHMIWNNQ